MAGLGRKVNENQAFPNPGQMETCAWPQTGLINPLEMSVIWMVLEELVEKEKKGLFVLSVPVLGPFSPP